MIDYKSFLKTISDKLAESIVILLIVAPGTYWLTKYCSEADKKEETAKKKQRDYKVEGRKNLWASQQISLRQK